MSRLAQLVAFIVFFLGIYGTGNTYVFWRINNLLGYQFGKITAILIILSTGSYLLGAIVDRMAHNIFTRIFYAMTASWLGILLFLLSALLIFEVINYFYKLPPKQSIYTIFIAVFLVSTYAIWNAFQVKIKEISIPLRNLKTETKLVQLSDLHVGTINNGEFLEKIITKVNKLKPDLVAITGDLVDGSGPLRHDTYARLNALNAPVYFVMGNHELYEDIDKVVNVLNDVDLIILLDEKIETNDLQLIGVTFSEGNKTITQTLDKIEISPELPTILLAHNPNAIKVAIQKGIDLQLSGHTHNGQIFPFNLFVKMVYRQIQGLYDYKGTKLYVSPGTGTWGPFMRLGSKNEITVLNLVPQTI